MVFRRLEYIKGNPNLSQKGQEKLFDEIIPIIEIVPIGRYKYKMISETAKCLSNSNLPKEKLKDYFEKLIEIACKISNKNYKRKAICSILKCLRDTLDLEKDNLFKDLVDKCLKEIVVYYT